MKRTRSLAAAAACLALAASAAEPAAGKGLINGTPVTSGVALPGSSHRYQALTVGGDRTVVVRVDRRSGRVGRWWELPGSFAVTAPAYDLVGTGIAADEGTLVLSGIHRDVPARRTSLAILSTRVLDHHPGARRNGAVAFVELRGDYGVQAVSPDGSTAFLTRLVAGPPSPVRFVLRALDTASGRILPPSAIAGNGEALAGMPLTRLADPSGCTVYTLYWETDGRGGAPTRASILALDTAAPGVERTELPRLRVESNPLLLRLRLDRAGRTLTVVRLSHVQGDRRVATLLRVPTRRLRPPRPTAAVGAVFSSPLLAITRAAWAAPSPPGPEVGEDGAMARET